MLSGGSDSMGALSLDPGSPVSLDPGLGSECAFAQHLLQALQARVLWVRPAWCWAVVLGLSLLWPEASCDYNLASKLAQLDHNFLTQVMGWRGGCASQA